MKLIKILISDTSVSNSVISALDDQIPKSTKKSPTFFVIYPQIITCIEQFSEKVKILAKTGTTIHIKKEFILPGVIVSVILEYPRKMGLFEKLARVLKRE